jgi:uncharacterized protein YggU (UPF0235/DUF167 family)
LPRKNVILVSGETNRSKVFLLRGITRREAETLLALPHSNSFSAQG